MCGIWASLHPEATRAAIDIVTHRGPDGGGWRTYQTPAGELALGHRRLAIIATDNSGLQPMSYDNGRYWVVFNGEIYNYRELRAELKDYGRSFATLSDTEVLLAAYAEWGESCLQKFNGMFGFVIYDVAERRLFVARDRFGVKPVYILANERGLAIASEIKQLTTLSSFAAKVNLPRLRDFFMSGVIDHTSETLFASVTQLRGGEFFSLDLDRWSVGKPLPVRRWHVLPNSDTVMPSLDEAVDRFDWLMRDSVKLRLRADVPVGSCLSGGLDSSTIVCLAHQASRGKSEGGYHTFTCAFDDPGLDEWSYAQAVIAQCHNVPHIVKPVANDLWNAIDDMIWHQDEPFGSTSIFAQWSVFKEARAAGITVMLDGQGADELLAGYHTVFGAVLAGFLLRGDWTGFRRELKAIRKRHKTSLERLALLTAASAPRLQPLVSLSRPFMSKAVSEPLWINRDLLENEFASYNAATSPPKRDNESPLGHLCRTQLTATSIPMLLHFEDRNSMAHSIEARVPFLDYRLVEYAIALGEMHKVLDGETKVLLRRSMASVIPEKVLHRQDKLGFPTPEQRWFQGELKDKVLQACRETIAAYPSIFNQAAAQTNVSDMLAGRRPFSPSVWRIMCFGRWAERFNASL